MDDIFLSKPEQAKFLGYELEAEEDLEEIKEHLRNYMNADAMVRLTMLIDIKVKLDAVFSNHKELEIWMDAKHESLDQRSFKTLIASGDVGNLVLVLSFLTRMTG